MAPKPPPKTRKKASTLFKKGTPKPPNAGRKKGQPNRTTTLLKDAILQAATLLGQDGKGKDGLVGYLKMLAIKERAVYARLLEKVLPMQVNVADNTAKIYTAEEAAERLRERGLPVPPGLLQIASGIGAAFAEDYENELDGIGLDEIEASSDRDIN
jgi:hypothetical protein